MEKEKEKKKQLLKFKIVKQERLFCITNKNNPIFLTVQYGRNSESKCQTKPWNVLSFSAL